MFQRFWDTAQKYLVACPLSVLRRPCNNEPSRWNLREYDRFKMPSTSSSHTHCSRTYLRHSLSSCASHGVRELTASRRCRDLAVLFRTSPDGGIVRNTFGSSGVLRRRRCLFGIGRPEDPEVLECQNCARCSGLLRRTTRSKDWRFSTAPAVPINENAVMSLVARDFREPVQFPEGGMVVGMPKDF